MTDGSTEFTEVIFKLIYLLLVGLPAYLPSLAAGVLLLSLFAWSLWLNFSRWRRR